MKLLLDETNNAEMLRVIDAQLESRHWGIMAKGKSPGKKPRYYIFDYRALGLVTGIIRYYYYREKVNIQLYYRGQKQDWELRPSLYRRCNNEDDIKRANDWKTSAIESIKGCFDPAGNEAEREALAQHYGLKTQFFDVVDHIQTALWFACDETEKDRGRSRQDEGVGYVEVIAVPMESEIIDLRRKPSEWLRPHIQQGFCVRFPNPDSKLGKLSKYLVMTFIISRQNLRAWSNYDALPHDYFYPNRKLDQGLVYWENAREKLISDGLLSVDAEGNEKWPV